MSDCFCTPRYQCLACEKAERQPRVAAPKRTSGIRKVAQCGTRAGYNKHLRLKEPTCAECKQAQNKAVQGWQSLNLR